MSTAKRAARAETKANKSKHPTANRTRDAEATHETPFKIFDLLLGLRLSFTFGKNKNSQYQP